VKRQRALAAYALGALVRRRGRSVAVAVGLAFVVALFASVLFLGDALRAEVEAGARYVPDLSVQRVVAGRPALLSTDITTSVRRIPGVRSVQARVWGYLYVPPISANVTVIGASGREALVHATLVDGRAMRAGERDACVLGAVLADALGVRAGGLIGLALGLKTVTGMFELALDYESYTGEVGGRRASVRGLALTPAFALRIRL